MPYPSLGLALQLAGCTGLPKDAEPVSDLELDRYLGQVCDTWRKEA